MESCIFCKIVRGELPSHKVWEDEHYYAFLNIYPNCEGEALVVPKEHLDSYIFALPDDAVNGLMKAAKTVAHKIDAAFSDVGRTAVVFEGFGVNHVHAKLYPLHGTTQDTWQPIPEPEGKFFERYEGYVSTHGTARADDTWLAEVASKIRDQ
jgi:diadenosine tetraphosphate (Ap4A) HIT family hydrolase